MSENYRRLAVVAPKTTTQFNQFLPSKDKQSGYVPAPLRKKRTDSTGNDGNRRSWASPMFTEEDGSFSRLGTGQSSTNELGTQRSSQAAWPFKYESSDSEAERPDPDLQLDDLAARRFHAPCALTPTNFALPMTSGESTTMPQTTRPKVMVTKVPQPTLTFLSSESQPVRRSASADASLYDDSEEEDDEIGYGDPVHDDLYSRKVQSVSTVHYDKFLPKFWTPEEDMHVQKIRLGSQRRPWYRKIQGFSQKKSGSSSEDSDCDVSPQLCVSSPPHSEPPTSHAQTSAQLSPNTPSSPTTQPHMPTEETSTARRLQLPDFWPRPDPTSGPRLIKCKRHPLLGRDHPSDPYNVSEDIFPDLENDDMFSRRTYAFHSNTELADVKYGGLLSLHHRSESSIRVVTQPSDARSTYPDLEKDDVVTRRFQRQSIRPSLSGGPDEYHPVPIPELWALPQKLQSKISPPCPPEQEAAQVYGDQNGAKHHKTDDMLVRRLGTVQNPTEVSQRSGGTQAGPSVPSFCSEEDLQKWQDIREASRLRYKKRLMVERMLENSPDNDGSKSIGDIPFEQAVQKVGYEDLQNFRTVVKENEDKWQDDLSKWKSRRRSVNLDIMKKKEEREQIETITGGSKKLKTFKEMEEERESREPGYKSRFGIFSTSEDQDVFDEPTPKTRVLPGRSNTVDSPYSLQQSRVRSLPSLLDDEPETGSLPTDEVDAPSSPVRSNLGSSPNLIDDPVPISVTSKPALLEATSTTRSTRTSANISSPPLETNSNSKPITKSINSVRPVPTPRQNQSQTSLYKPLSTETQQPVTTRVSASLPRNYQRSDSARITSVVTPRPFGATNTKLASLPRPYTVDDSEKRINGDTNSSKRTAVNFLTSSIQSSNKGERNGEEQIRPPTASTVTPVSRVAPQPKAVSTDKSTQENFREMRISLNQKPNSSHDFGFQTNWDSIGATVKSITQGSPAELCHLQTGDKILAVNGQMVADMSFEQWKKSMDEARQEGSLFMDIRRQGNNNLPSLPFQSHKVINLTSTDPLGSPEPYANVSLDFTSRPSTDPTVKSVNVSSQLVNSLRSDGINGGTNEESVALRNKEPVSLKNLKRRSEFFEQGGSENQIADVSVPSPSTASTRWSWDPEEERRRQEKWQKEQERQLQEKYRQDQEKLKEEFRKAQQEAVTEGPKQDQAESRSLKLQQESLRLKEEEERRKREEEEDRKRKEAQKRLEEEKKKREELKRLEEERKKDEEELKRREEEKRRREEESLRLQRKREEEDERRRREAQQRLQAKDTDYNFPELSYSHRAKSKSTPELDEKETTDIKGVYSKNRGLAGWLLQEELRRKRDPAILGRHTASQLDLERRNLLSAMRYSNPGRAVSSGSSDSSSNAARQNKKEPVSQAESERQQIIQDMKKKTSLLPDNKWIRPDTVNNVNKQPVNVPMRRGESLDNLDSTTTRQSWRSSWTPGITSSVPDYSRPYPSLSSNRPSLAQSTSTTSTYSKNQSSSDNRSVSGKKMCTYCEMPLGKGAAMIIESLGLCFHLHCFKCFQCKTDLGGSENGAEVRIRNKQLFCNSCYMHVKTGQPTAM